MCENLKLKFIMKEKKHNFIEKQQKLKLLYQNNIIYNKVHLIIKIFDLRIITAKILGKEKIEKSLTLETLLILEIEH